MTSQIVGVDTRLLAGVYLQETTGCRQAKKDLVAAKVGRLDSAGASNLPEISFRNTVRRNPGRFGFSQTADVSGRWLDDRYSELADPESSYNLAYATASRLSDIVSDLADAMEARLMRPVSRQQGRAIARDRTFRVYRESALIGQAYTSVQNRAELFFDELFALGNDGYIEKYGWGVQVDRFGVNGYSNGLDSTCNIPPFRC